MRLSDLLHADVFDVDGVAVGRVRDVRLVQDGPLQGLTGAAFRVDGLLVGRSAVAVRLGFHRSSVRGPWPLVPIFRRLEHRIRYVRWPEVASWSDGVVRLNCRAAELGAMPSVEAEAAGSGSG
jgi:hypothetical protein